MKKLVFVAALAMLSTSIFSPGAKAGFNPLKVAKKVVKAPVNLVKNLFGDKRCPPCHQAQLPVWYVYYYPQGTACPARFAGAYNNYAAACNAVRYYQSLRMYAYAQRVR